MMKFRAFSTFGLFAVLLSWAVVATASEPRSLNWPDLQPDSLRQLEEQAYKEMGRIHDMSEEKREAYDLVREELSLRKRIELGFIDEDRLDDKAKESLANAPSKRYPKALAYWKSIDTLYNEIEKQRAEPNQTLNDQNIRMPGYLLPLEFTKDKITEFLLVPYIGACMHEPTPPPNQMVFVTVDKPFVSDRLYQAVWVEGVMRSKKGTHQLFLVDGTTDVDAGYTMQATQIEPYER